MYYNLYALFNSAIVGGELRTFFFSKKELEIIYNQNLLHFLYPATNDVVYKKYYNKEIFETQKYDNTIFLIKSIFSKEKINYSFLNSAIIQAFYFDKSLRSKKDIELFVDKDNYKKAILILTSNGFSAMDSSFDNESFTMRKNGFYIILYNSFFPKNSKYYNYFNSPFEHIIVISEYQCILSSTYLFEYLICMMAERLFDSGIGFVSLLDCYFIQKEGGIDYLKLSEDLKELQLFDFYQYINQSLYVIFKNDFFKNDSVNATLFLNYIEQFKFNLEITLNERLFFTIVLSKGKTRYILSRIFITFPQMKKQYKLCRFKFLYPFFLIIRISDIFIHKSKLIYEVISMDNKRIKERISLYSDLGIL